MIGMPATIPALVHARAAASADRIALYEWNPARGRAIPCGTWSEWLDASLDVAAALVSSGATRGRTVAILAGNTRVWPVADVGVILAGMVSVGIYPTASVMQVRALIEDSEAAVVIVDSFDHLARVRAATAGLGVTIVVAAGDGAEGIARPEREVGWQAWCEEGRRARTERPAVAAELARRMSMASGDDIAMLVYTSGSTGAAKGARISHRYVVESARSVRDTLRLDSSDSSLSFLPFCHASERIFGLYTRIACGMGATLVEDHARLWDAGRAAQPTIFGGLPRFFEKVYEALLAERRDATADTRARWDSAESLGRDRMARRIAGLPVPLALEQEWREAAEPVRAALARFFGPRLRIATSGGATLPVEVARYLDACGLTVLGAYGQTEHLCVAFNRPESFRHDSVGLPMPGSVLRIAEDGEVLVARSALTFSGYHRRPEETARAFTDDGLWLRTGDLGEIDNGTFLRITGRKKEIIALSNGKKVAPLAIEARLCEAPLIAHAMLYGDGRPYVTALLTLRPALAERWREEHGIEGASADLVRHPAFVREVQEIVNRINADISRPEQVRRFVVLPHELTLEAGELTPTHKLRRVAIRERYAGALDALYEGTA